MNNKNRFAIRHFAISVILFAGFVLFANQAMGRETTASSNAIDAQVGLAPTDQNCEALMKQIDDLVDKVERVSERMGRVGKAIEDNKGTPETLEQNKRTLETDRSTLRETKLAIANLAEKLCACCAQKAGQTTAGAPDKNCDALMKQIDDNVDKVERVSERMGRVGEAIEDNVGTPETLEQNKRTLETDRSTLRKTKLAIAKLAENLCECCSKKADSTGITQPPTGQVPQTGLKTNEINFNFSFIREDSDPRFNTYGFNGSFTHYLNPTVGLSGDFNAHFKSENSVDLSKYSVLGGITIVPFEGAKTTDKVTVSTHALFGVSHFRADSGVSSFTDNAFTMKLGGALDVNVNENVFIRPIQIDYAPTFFGDNTQHNVQFGFGVGFRF